MTAKKKIDPKKILPGDTVDLSNNEKRQWVTVIVDAVVKTKTGTTIEGLGATFDLSHWTIEEHVPTNLTPTVAGLYLAPGSLSKQTKVYLLDGDGTWHFGWTSVSPMGGRDLRELGRDDLIHMVPA